MSQPVHGPGSSVLAFLIADIRGYTSFTRTHGDEAAAHLASTFAELAREAVEAHDGAVIELRGDEVLATFSSPRQALRAAVELQAVLADEAVITDLPLHVGIGLDIGEAVPVEGGYRGDALNFAARLCGVAAGGEILVSDGMRQVVGEMDGVSIEPVDALVLKGIDTPVRAGRIGAAEPAAVRPVARQAAESAVPVELDPITPLFGRDASARRLRWAWRRARAGRGSTVAITGPTGIGKTRLAAEPVSVASQNGAAVAYGSALGGGVTVALARLSDETAAGATIVVIDDLESASDEDLSAVREAAQRVASNPSLLIVAATDDARAAVAGVLRASADDRATIRLGPIGQEAVAEIVATYAPDARDSAPIWAIAEASAGRPAVVHELAASWARQEVGRRLGDAVERTVSGRRDLRRLESEVASSVVDLQLARTRLNLTSRGGRLTEADQCPFMGLVAFDVGDADLFFGRERLVAEMIGRLAGSSFLGVVGPSGSGKSSAVRAGLIPALSSGALPGTESWTRVMFRPGAHPLAELDRVLYAALPADLRERYSAAVTGGDAGDPLAAAAALLPADARPLLVVDQFEEIFTTTDAPERDAFVAVIERAARDGQATVVAAIRADFYGRCADYPVLAELLSEGHVLVGAMSAAEYRRAIEGPARRASLAMDSALVDALVDEVVDQPGALPLLSTALVELWERREGRAIRLSAYAATGGVRGAVARLAESTYGALDMEQQQITRGLFLRLASGEGDTVVRRRVSLAELDAVENPQVATVISALTQARLLTVGEGSIEVAHEALLREWPRLAEWLEDDRSGRQLREHLTSTAREWQARDHDPAELYRGTRLSTAIDWTTQHTLELTETERAFLNESRQATTAESERQRRTNRRLRGLLALAGLALVIALGAGALAFLQAQAATRSATVADAQRIGAKALIEPNLDVSLLLAREGVALDDDSATRTDLLSAIVRSPAAIGAWRLPISGRPLGISVSPDGKDLLVRNNQDDVVLIDSATGGLIRDLGSGYAAWFAPDGSIVQGSGPPGSGLVTVERIGDATPRLTIPIKSKNTFSVSPDATTMATIDDDMHGITLTDTATLATSGHIDALPNTTLLDVWQYGNGVLGVVHDGSITSPADLNAAYDGPVLLEWWPSGASKPTTAIPSTGGADGVWAIDPATTKIALPESSDTVAIYDLATGQRHKPTLDHHSVVGMTFTPDGRTLVTAGDDRLLDVWDADTGQLRDTWAGHAGRVFGPAISDVGGHLTAWSIGLDGQLIEWDMTGDRRIDRPLSVGAAAMRDGSAVQTIAVSPDGRFVAATTDGGRVTVKDAKTLATVKQLQALPPDAIAMTLAFSPDSKTLAVGGQGDQSVATWDTASWTATGPVFTVPTPSPSPGASPGSPPAPDGVTSVAWAPDGGLLASGSADGQISLWDPHSGHLAKTLDVPGSVFDLAFSGDSKSLAVTYSATDPSAGKAAVWSLPDGTLRYEVSVDDDYGSPFAATFSHDGKLLATGGGIGEIRFWDAATGAKIGRPVFGNAGWVSTLAFTADDSVLVAAGTDGTVRLIDPVERQQLGASLPGGVTDSIAAVGPDDRVFVDYEDTGLGYVWDISLDSLKTHACTLAGRTLTQTEWNQYLPGRPYQPTCGPG